MPDTRVPYHLVYAIVPIVYGGYALSLWLRARRVRRLARGLARSSS